MLVMDCHAIVILLATVGVVFIGVLNGITCLLGAGLIYVGVRLKEELEQHEDIISLLDEIDLGGITVSEIADIIIKVIITVGVFAIVTSLIGGIGACCKLRPLLLLYIGIIILCIFVELTLLGYWIKFITSVHEFLYGEFRRLLKKYEGPTELHLISAGWNAIFILFTCCGVKPVTSTYNDFETLPSKWWNSTSRAGDVIPSSCCEDVSIDNYMNYTNTACTQSYTGYHEAGCYDAFEDLFNMLASVAITVISTIVLIEVAAIVFSVIIVYVESKRKRTGVVV